MTDCIVIGGGIIGMLTAHYLRHSGCEVTLLEKGRTGQESSWAGGGIVSPLYPWRYRDSVTRLASWGQQAYPALCSELLENSGIDPEYTVSGLMMIAPDEQQQAQQWAQQHNRPLQLIDAAGMAEIEPAMHSEAGSAIWMENVAQIRNPRIAKSLRASIEQAGVTIMENSPVVDFQLQGSRVDGLITPAGRFSADRYAVCGGAWSSELLQPTGVTVPIRPVQGQMILFRANPGEIQRMVLEQDRYVIPRRDGRVLFGSTVEDVGFKRHTTAAAREELQQIARQRFPVLANRPIEHHWAGLRPGKTDGIPVISRHPRLDNLFINAGHFRNGVVLAPASCWLMKQLMLDEEAAFDAADYALV